MCSTQSTCYKVDVIKNLFLRACVRDEQSATFIGGCSVFVAACSVLQEDKPFGIAVQTQYPSLYLSLSRRRERERQKKKKTLSIIKVECDALRTSQMFGWARYP